MRANDRLLTKLPFHWESARPFKERGGGNQRIIDDPPSEFVRQYKLELMLALAMLWGDRGSEKSQSKESKRS